MASLPSYRLPEPVRGETNDAMLGTIPFDFPAGVVEPKSEQEAMVLAWMAGVGLATLTEPAGMPEKAAKSGASSKNSEVAGAAQ